MAKRRSKSKPATKPRATKPRASWQGNLRFGLVAFSVEAFNALNRAGSDIRFHQLHATCHRRIRYEKVCPLHGPVSQEEIVSGYEQRKGKYIEIDAGELEALRTENERALTIDAFIEPDRIDPLYYDGRMYYLLPAEASSQEPYAVIVAAMDKEQQYGIGHVVLSGKDQLAVVRPVEGILHLALLNYDAEIRRPKDVAAALPGTTPQARQVRMAQSLIRDWSGDDFDFGQYADTYRERVEKLINAKSKGRPIPVPEEEEAPATINLMDALKKSIGHAPTPRKRKSGSRKTSPRKSGSHKKRTA